MQPERFTVAVPESDLDDLHRRLEATRWPDEIENDEWKYGTNLTYLKELCAYWRGEYNWRAQEDFLRSFAHFAVNIGGQRIHYVHERGKGPQPVPIVLTHGWPSTFYEMSKLIPLLADPAAHGGDPHDAFHVVVPSLPGYGFSASPKRSGVTTFVIAQIWAKLMSEVLGYRRFAAHGGDIGSGVTAWLGFQFPENVVGIHVTAVRQPHIDDDSPPLSRAEHEYRRLREAWYDDEGGYEHLQGTRPQTLAYGLTDSPVGLAAWIVEKYRAWSDCHGDIESRFTKDELLTNIALYWFTGTVNAANRLYYAHRHRGRHLRKGERIDVPCGVCLTVEPVDRAPREWAERAYNVQRFTTLDRGGHFLALEEPQLLADDIRAFFRPLRGG